MLKSELHCLTRSWHLHQQMKDDCRKFMTNYCDSQSDIIFFFPFTLRYINNKIGIKLPHLFRANPPANERWLQKRKRANELIIISRITFETMKEFIRSRVRLVLMQIICYIPFGIYPWLLLPSQGCRRINFKKCSISTIYQPAEQNFLHVENIFKYTVDLRECPSKNFFTRAIRSATKLYNIEKVRY